MLEQLTEQLADITVHCVPGELSEHCYLVCSKGYVYAASTLDELVLQMLLEWQHDSHSVGNDDIGYSYLDTLYTE